MRDWSNIVAEHGDAVWRTVYRLVGNYEDARDCHQEVFISAWRFNQRKQVEHWPAFLQTLATNKAMDLLRRRYVRANRNHQSIDDLDMPGDQPEPIDFCMADELMHRVRQALAQLPEQQAQALWLRCMEKMPSEQVAKQLATDTKNVRVLVHRARKKINQFLVQCPINESTG